MGSAGWVAVWADLGAWVGRRWRVCGGAGAGGAGGVGAGVLGSPVGGRDAGWMGGFGGSGARVGMATGKGRLKIKKRARSDVVFCVLFNCLATYLAELGHMLCMAMAKRGRSRLIVLSCPLDAGVNIPMRQFEIFLYSCRAWMICLDHVHFKHRMLDLCLLL